MGRAVNRSGEGEKRGQDFNLANSLSLFGFGKMQHAPSQLSPCVGERRSGLFTFPLCAKLSWFLAMNKMHTRSDAHTDIHACTHRHPHCLSCSPFLTLVQMCYTSKEQANQTNSTLQFHCKFTKHLPAQALLHTFPLKKILPCFE